MFCFFCSSQNTDDWQTIALCQMDDNSVKTGVTPGAGHQALHQNNISGLGGGPAEATVQVE